MATTTQIAQWKPGVAESGQAWNADLNNIAAHYGLTLAQLESANPQISNPNSIPAGTSINIPDSGSGTAGGTSGGQSTTGGGTSGGATTAPTPAGSPGGGTTSQIPGWATGTGYDTSAADAGSANGIVAGASGVQQYQSGQAQSMSALQTFFGSGPGYAPQYLPSYGAGATQPQAQQVQSGSASGLPAAKSARNASYQGMQAASGVSHDERL